MLNWFNWENATKETGAYIPNIPPKSPVYIYIMFPVDCPLNHYWILLVFVSSLRGGSECPRGIRVAELNMEPWSNQATW